MRERSGNIPIFLVGNKSDLKETIGETINYDKIIRKVNEHNLIGYIETSALKDKNVVQLFKNLSLGALFDLKPRLGEIDINDHFRFKILLIGDAARQVDPITGGGLTHCLEGGKIAGETIGKAIDSQDFSKECLSEYEALWKEAFGKKIKRNYMVKEILLDMEDKTLNMLADSLKDFKFEEISTLGLIKALVLKHPTLLMKLRPLMKVTKDS